MLHSTVIQTYLISYQPLPLFFVLTLKYCNWKKIKRYKHTWPFSLEEKKINMRVVQERLLLLWDPRRGISTGAEEEDDSGTSTPAPTPTPTPATPATADAGGKDILCPPPPPPPPPNIG
jgi:hypothetical protein